MRTLLVGKVGIVDVRDRCLVGAAQQDASQLGASRINAAGEDQRGVTEIDERNFAAVLDTPPMA